jgi:hypothetical protein
MKRIILFAIFLLSQISLAEAFELEGLQVEGRVAYFLPENKRIRHVYSDLGFPEYELEVAMPIGCYFSDCIPDLNLDVWTNVSYYEKKGRSYSLHDKTRVTNWALNAGVSYYFPICGPIRPYVGIGGGAAHVEFHDKSQYVKQHREEWGGGFLAKLGLKYDVTCNIFIDVFADYSYNWCNFNRSKRCIEVHNVNTGGLKLGAGIGYRF